MSRGRAGGPEGWLAEMEVGSAHVCAPSFLHSRIKTMPRLGVLATPKQGQQFLLLDVEQSQNIPVELLV